MPLGDFGAGSCLLYDMPECIHLMAETRSELAPKTHLFPCRNLLNHRRTGDFALRIETLHIIEYTGRDLRIAI